VKERVAVFGGSFDPPHLGHALACFWALESGQVDRVLLIPAALHAFGKQYTARFDQRMAMCRLAVQRLADAVSVSDIEGRRPGVSYMVDTLRALEQEMPASTFRLLVGTDVAQEVHKWRESEEVLRRAPLLELPRPLPGQRFDERPGALPPISSTQVRDALKSGHGVEHLLAATVTAYIRSHGLYEVR